MAKLTEEMRADLKKKGREDLIEVFDINASGYAGVLSNGHIVDRRKHPKAMPIQENTLLGIPKPKKLK